MKLSDLGSEGALYAVASHVEGGKSDDPRLGAAVIGPIKDLRKPLRIVVPVAKQIGGIVVDTQGRPVVGLRLSACALSAESPDITLYSRNAVTDAQGRFAIDHLGTGKHRVHLEGRHRFLRVEPVVVMAGSDDVRFTLDPGKQVVVTIVGPDGKPLSDAAVKISTRDVKPRSTARARTVGDGTAILKPVVAGAVYELEVHPPGDCWDLQNLRRKQWTPAEETIQLAQGIVIGGRVEDADGNLVRNAQIRYESEGFQRGYIRARDGTFRVGRLPVERITLCAWWPEQNTTGDGHAPHVVVKGTSKLDIVLRLGR